MNKIIRNSLSSIILLALSACNLFAPATPGAVQSSVLTLTVQTQDNVTTFNQAGEIVNYQYVITNTGTTPLAGPVIVNDSPRQVACPQLTTVGNQDDYLDQNETITCTAAYTITESDVTTGSVTNVAVATLGGITSNQTGITLTRGQAPPSTVLTLTKTASSQTYGQVGETITYMYVLTNVGNEPLGPAQFTISDDKLGAPFACGPDATTIAPAQTLPCSASYLITEADMSAANVTNSATASGAGQITAAATVTITNLLAPATATPPTPATSAPPPSSNLSPGSTIQHQVAVGEWLIQIGRCYGATFDELRDANPQILDPDFILPAMIVTVPRIGSAGPIYGPPCITFHTVQSGETWESIAQRYNADLVVLRLVNPGGLVAGQSIKIPLNSAGGGPVVVTPGATLIPTTAATTVAPMRITFDPGQNTASRIGILNPNETVQYVVAATQGQVLTINLTATANEINLGVIGPTGLALKQPDPTYTWTATVATGGDHTISLTSILGNSSKSYTLQVSLTAATTPDPSTATPTSTTPVSQSNARP